MMNGIHDNSDTMSREEYIDGERVASVPAAAISQKASISQYERAGFAHVVKRPWGSYPDVPREKTS